MPSRKAKGNHVLLRMAVLSSELADSCPQSLKELLVIRDLRHPAHASSRGRISARRGGVVALTQHRQFYRLRNEFAGMGNDQKWSEKDLEPGDGCFFNYLARSSGREEFISWIGCDLPSTGLTGAP